MVFSFRKKTESAPADKAPPPAPAPVTVPDLTARFRDAAYGVYCRTRAYEQVVDAGLPLQEWLEMHRLAPEQWVIKRRTRRPAPESATGFGVEQAPYQADAVNFYKAVEILATYERTQDGLGRAPVAEPDIKTLGIQYLRAFALREGILFTLDGKPVPTTEDGRVLCDDAFPDHDLAAVLKIAQDAPPAVIDVPALPGNLLPQVKILNRNYHISCRATGWKELLDTLHALQAFTKDACKEGWVELAPHDPFYNAEHNCSRRYNIILGTRKLLYARGDFERSLSTAMTDKNTASAMLRAYDLFELKIILCAFRAALEIHGRGSFVTTGRGALRSRLERLGYDKNAMTDDILDNIARQEKSAVYPPEMDDIVQWFETLFDNVMKAQDNASPPAVPVLPDLLPKLRL